jgi:hypothetical protein
MTPRARCEIFAVLGRAFVPAQTHALLAVLHARLAWFVLAARAKRFGGWRGVSVAARAFQSFVDPLQITQTPFVLFARRAFAAQRDKTAGRDELAGHTAALAAVVWEWIGAVNAKWRGRAWIYTVHFILRCFLLRVMRVSV